MTRSMLRIVSTILVGGLICAPVAGAQDSAFLRYNPNPSIIAGQIRLALQRGQQAQTMLATGPLAAESVRAMRAIVYDSYVLARAAQGGVEMAMAHSKFPDPTLPLQRDLIWRARTNLIRCMKALDEWAVGLPNPEYRAANESAANAANESLRSAIQPLENLLVLLP
jgi:hypothetical protein